ncbi:MAG: carbohydrate porin [Proteobacteria bacterium]|nr:carbohydrate porin [Pseudomonadota bacterium]
MAGSFARGAASIGAVLALGLPWHAHAETEPSESPDGIALRVILVGVGQAIDGGSADAGTHEARGNGRGDVVAEFPGGTIGDAAGKLVTHLRFGQGGGVSLRPTYTSTPNTTTFEASDGSRTIHVTVAEAWYQLDVPLSRDGPKAAPHGRLELTAGKMDPFAFFDQNAVAGDETTQFLNNVFVHNPLLDSGGDVGADRFGFSPGVRVRYAIGRDDADNWGASVGMFGSGNGADFTASFGHPFVIAQLDTTRSLVDGQPGTYRAYAWTNGAASGFDGSRARRSGWGMSIDQRIGDTATLFARFGHETQGSDRTRFDRALAVGAELGGGWWGRAADAAGLAFGLLHTSSAYAGATAADRELAGYAASGDETSIEAYYRWQLDKRLELSPDVQWILRPGGDGAAPAAFVAGVRVRVALER